MAETKTRMRLGRKRRVVGREEILAAARTIGVRKGWKAVTIRAVAQKLRYTSPILYEHFRNKEDILTQLAIEGQLRLAKEIAEELPRPPDAAILVMVERYWSFMVGNSQIYRLMNGMDGVPIDRMKVASIAQSSFEAAKDVIRAWVAEEDTAADVVDTLIDELWAVLHGMAALYLDRAAPFDLERAQESVRKILLGTRERGFRRR